MARENEADRRPKSYPGGTLGAITVSDATVLSPIPTVLVVSCTVAGNVALRMLDGNTATIAVPTGVTTLELQFDQLKSTGTTATATYCALYSF